MLGHSSIRTTMDLYSHLIESDHREAADEMEAMFGEGPAGVSTGVTVARIVADRTL